MFSLQYFSAFNSESYLMFIMHDTPPGAGHGGRIAEATPGFLGLGDMSWFIVYISLQEIRISNF